MLTLTITFGVGTTKGISIYDVTKSVFYTPYFKKAGNHAIISLKDAIFEITRTENLLLVGTGNSGLIVFTKDNKTGKQILFSGRKDSYNVSCIQYDSMRHAI
jgi:hypothetical protein